MIYLWHMLAGLVFAGTGAIARGWCNHRWHQLLVGFLGVALETIVVVGVVG